jgi:acyl-CoA synthetase (AMP-forming)/AMP-acid ligase II
MILRGENDKATPASGGNRATLDELFRRAGVRSSSGLALVDPPNRESFTDGAPRQLTFAQVDRAISALAARLCRLGLQTDTVVAIQLANTVENVITFMAVLRAGMIPVPLPLLWRRHDMTAGLSHIGAKAIITATRIGTIAHAEIAMQVAAELFPVRFVCAFGRRAPDGVVPLDEIFAAEQAIPVVPRINRIGQPGDHAADHVAAVTLDVTAVGVVPVARSHMELLAAGAATYLEAGAPQNGRILSTIPPASLAGLALTLLPWLTGGGTLSLHHGFDAKTFAAQAADHRDGMIVLPGPALTPLAQTAIFGGANQTILALWRSPEQLATAALWHGEATLVDVSSFGEVGLIAACRSHDGMPADVPHGRVGTPRATGTVSVAETTRSKKGTLMLRGPMVPVHAFPPGTERGPDPHLEAEVTGFVDTGSTCRLDSDGRTLIVTGPPRSITAIGGYRFRPLDVETQVAGADPTATVVALPDGMLAQRLAGSALNNGAVRAQLLENGVNPLISGAFRPRGQAAA